MAFSSCILTCSWLCISFFSLTMIFWMFIHVWIWVLFIQLDLLQLGLLLFCKWYLSAVHIKTHLLRYKFIFSRWMTFYNLLSLLSSHKLLLRSCWRQILSLTIWLPTFWQPFLHNKTSLFSSFNISSILIVILISRIDSRNKQWLACLASHCTFGILFSIIFKMCLWASMITKLISSSLHWRWYLPRLLSNTIFWG